MPLLMNSVMFRIISERYPDISDEEAEEVRQHVVAQMAIMAIKKSEQSTPPTSATPPSSGNDNGDDRKDDDKKRQPADSLIQHARKLMDVHELSIDLIDSINPFNGSYEVIARALNTSTLAQVRAAIRTQKNGLTPDEAMALLPKIRQFTQDNGREPSLESPSDLETELAEAMSIIRREVAKRRAEQSQEA